jgi:adenosylmethionine-8-amino-7-oxononanoate aminotransferase
MCGVELVADRATKEPFAAHLQAGKRVCDALRDDGIVLRPLGDTLVLMPAPAMAEDDLRFLVERTAAATERVTLDLA